MRMLEISITSLPQEQFPQPAKQKEALGKFHKKTHDETKLHQDVKCYIKQHQFKINATNQHDLYSEQEHINAIRPYKQKCII